jgi:2-polyprenyl-6-methoxyphenol hydroxylase-like FAD-dependent oxidoreductase
VRWWREHDVRPLPEWSAAMTRLRYVGADGAIVHEQDCRYRVSSFDAIYRDLSAGLDGDRYRLGSEVTGFEVDDGGVTVALADGTSERADLLVGADGIRSVVRRSIDPGSPAPRYVGLTNFGGFTAAADLRRDPGLEREAWTMTFGRRAFFGAAPTPAGDVVWFVNWPRPAIEAGERRATSDATWTARLVELVADDAGPAADLIAAGTLQLAGDSTFDLGHVPSWHRGPLVIVGDAAHAPSPSSGQGAAMAAEDGVILAKALRDVRGVEPALAAYENARRARVEKIVAAGARSSSAKIPGGIGRAFRDVAMRAIFRWVVTDRSMAWQFDHRVEWDRPLGA